MISLFDKLAAVLRRDLLIAIRHRTGFLVTAVGLLVQLAAFYFLSRSIGPAFRPKGVEYFPFLLIGTGLYTFFVLSAQAFLSAVQEAQQTGTMEVLMTTSTAPAELVILSSISAFAGSLANLTFYVFAGVAIFQAPTQVNAVSCVVVLAFSLGIAMAIGIGAAAIQITWQKGSALLWLMSSGVWLLSGAMFPIESLPRPLLLLGKMIPITHAVDGMRGAILQGLSPRAMAPTLAALAGFTLVLLPLSLAGLSLSLRHARRGGTLSFY